MCMIDIQLYEDITCIDDDMMLADYDWTCIDDDFARVDDDITLYAECDGMTPEEIQDSNIELGILEYIQSYYLHNVRCEHKYPLSMFYADIVEKIKTESWCNNEQQHTAKNENAA